MKKKSNGTLPGRINVRGFKQVEGQHYNGTTISSPVTNSATIRIVRVLMVMADMIAHVVDVTGAFLHGEFEDSNKIHMKIPKGFKKHFLAESVLLLLKCLYGLKQATKAFGDSSYALQKQWDLHKAMQIPISTSSGLKGELSQ
jgi:hypothetical protein